ncbi:Transposon Tf2-9 polyprotein [Dictyocoela muelleri]|nr:Transposon Tf2-9 polyprotein [Dictyocoela muelleri]
MQSLKSLKPKSKRHIQKIVGIINWYRGFVKNASSKILFLTEKLKKDVPFSWKNSDADKLSEIMQEIESKIILKYHNPNKSFTLKTDASKNAFGGVLSQDNHVIGFYSYKFSESERNYTTTEKETLAVLKCLRHFKPLIFASKVIIYTDNKNLIPEKPLSSRIQRWKLLLQEFDYEVKHINGVNNIVADSLSRINFINNDNLIEINWERIKKAQEDENLTYKLSNKKFFLNENGLITDLNKRVFIPENYKSEFIKNIHDLLLHPGNTRTYLSLRNFFTSKSFKATVNQVVKKCQICSKTKNSNKIYGYSKGFLSSENPFKFISSVIF